MHSPPGAHRSPSQRAIELGLGLGLQFLALQEESEVAAAAARRRATAAANELEELGLNEGGEGPSQSTEPLPLEEAEAGATLEMEVEGDPLEPLETPDGNPGMTQDELAEFCVLAGVRTVTDSELPIMTSEFYTKHMLPAKPAGLTMDIKKSSYKKLSKLLQKYEKKGLLSQKIVHKKDVISAIHRENELFAAKLEAGAVSPPEAAVVSLPATLQPPAGKIEVTSCYKYPSSLRALMPAAGGGGQEELFTEAQVGEALLQYAASGSQLSPDMNFVALDRLLAANLFNKREAAIEGNPHPLENLRTRLLAKLQTFHRIVRLTPEGEAVEKVSKGSVKAIGIQTEERQGGRKHVTKVVGVEPFGLIPEDLAGDLQRKFKTSSSVQKLPGKTEVGKEIQLQGDLLAQIEKYFETAYGIDKKYIDAVQKRKANK